MLVGPMKMSSKGRVSSIETEKFLVWLSFEDDGFSIEAFVEEDFLWGKLLETRVSENEAIVDVSNMFDK